MENAICATLTKPRRVDSVKHDCIRMKVAGVVNTVCFQKARICVEKLCYHMPLKFCQPQIIEMFQMDWYEYISKMKREIGGKIWSSKDTVAVFINDEFLGNDVEFVRYMSQDYIFSLPIGAEYYENVAAEHIKQLMEKSKRKYVYFTICTDHSVIGSLVFMLYSDLLPLTCQHFLNLCTGYDKVQNCYHEAHYVNKQVHRIAKNGWIQCGGSEDFDLQVVLDNVAVIPDESYCVPHDRRGVLSMANNGKHCNQSQFFICLKANPWMNQYYVAFGQLVDGAKALKALEDVPTYYEEPVKRIGISQCGEYLFGDEVKLESVARAFPTHQKVCMEGETVDVDPFDFYAITPWLDNIADKIDVRDTASILMAERYLHGLYCLATDYAPEMDMRMYDKIDLSDPVREDATTAKLYELFSKFDPYTMSEQDKMTFVSQVSKIILAYMFCHEYNEFCLKHISLNTHATINKILELAHEISVRAVEKTEWGSSASCRYGTSKISRIFEAKSGNKVLVSEACMQLLEAILNKAIFCLMKTIEREE